jgi:hypothetical protein
MPGFRPEAIRARSCDKPSRPGPISFARLIGLPDDFILPVTLWIVIRP